MQKLKSHKFFLKNEYIFSIKIVKVFLPNNFTWIDVDVSSS